jgi:flagellar hook-associated protein 1
MAGLFDVLGVGGSALLAQQHGVQVASHNISNSGTLGFHRQELGLEGQGPATLGVTDKGVTRVMDQLLGRQILVQQGQTGYADTRAQGLKNVEALTGQLDELGLESSLDNFFASWRELASASQDAATRATALACTEDLAQRIRGAANDLVDAQQQADGEVRSRVDEANPLIDRVASLNQAIHVAETSGTQAADLRDQRDVAVGQLADLLGASAFTDGNDAVSVVVSGVAVVQGGVSRHLEVEPDATTGLNRVYVSDGARVDLTQRMGSGRVGALLTLRDQDLAQALAKLDTFAFDLATATNATHQAGVGLDGVSGRNLFVPPAAVAGAALGLSVDPGVAGNPDRLGAALVAGAPGDGRGANAMVQLASTLVANGGTSTLSQALLANLSGLGTAVQSASDDFAAQTERLSQLETLREGQSGVSIEEQMLLLERYQRGFQAAAKVVSAVDQMLQDLLAIGGGA